jgi:hypothetical protein
VWGRCNRSRILHSESAGIEGSTLPVPANSRILHGLVTRVDGPAFKRSKIHSGKTVTFLKLVARVASFGCFSGDWSRRARSVTGHLAYKMTE